MNDSASTPRLGREAIHTFWDNTLPPQLTVRPGETVTFETLEASYGARARDLPDRVSAEFADDLVDLIGRGAYAEVNPALKGHPLTGPVAVADAEPGDTLAIEILDIATADWGWTACRPGGIGLLDAEIEREDAFYWDLRDRRSATFAPGIQVPLRPFCGVMGVAPAAKGRHSTAPPAAHGGNMDIRQLTAGATLYLPVLVPGALFSVGDVHGAQGDGEVSGTGIETEATVRLRFDLLKGHAIRQPQLRTATNPDALSGPYFATTGHDPDPRDAAREALRGMLDYLQREYGLSRTRAYILASVCVDLKLSQVVDAPNWTVSAFLPLSIFANEA